jgi:hypothetical protein
MAVNPRHRIFTKEICLFPHYPQML